MADVPSTVPSADATPDTPAERMAVGFCRVLRSAGVKVPASATINYAEALAAVGVDEPEPVYWAGRATLVRRPEDIEAYDKAFAAWWQRSGGFVTLTESLPDEVTLALDDDEAADGESEAEPDDGEIQSVRFSRHEILADKDFGDCTPEELAELSELLTELRFTTHRRSSRRQVPAGRKGDRHDLRRTVRWALRHQGEPIHRAMTADASRPRRLVMILDVSGSMETYARALLRFAHAAVVARSRVEVFALGTRLTRVTRHLANRDPDVALAAATPAVADWSGGTRLGEGIEEFNNSWGIRGMARGAVLVILSDGWDRGDPDLLGEQMARLHRVTHDLVWVNPLKATEGYAPLAAGMAAALPHVDRFVAGNSYRSLRELAAILADDAGPRVGA